MQNRAGYTAKERLNQLSIQSRQWAAETQQQTVGFAVSVSIML
jgi:hypothetical protein